MGALLRDEASIETLKRQDTLLRGVAVYEEAYNREVERVARVNERRKSAGCVPSCRRIPDSPLVLTTYWRNEFRTEPEVVTGERCEGGRQ